jgi:sugar lactone lactonase YvrE
MKRLLPFLALLAALPVLAQSPTAPVPNSAPLEVVASLDQQPTGVAASKSGRLFACFPYWADSHTYSVAELKPGQQPIPYPTPDWNEVAYAQVAPERHFVCVQSVYIDSEDKLWALDAGAPEFSSQVHGAKLIKIDLASNTIEKIYPFDADLAPPKSYLNDVRIDMEHHVAYISESGLGSIIVLDLNSGRGRRLLASSPETKSISGFIVEIDGQQMRTQDGFLFSANCDGIALDPTDAWLYFSALSGGHLYRIATVDLLNDKLDEAALEKKIQTMMTIPAADGLMAGPDGLIYITSPEDHSVRGFSPSQVGPLQVAAEDPRLVWPDSLALSPDGWMYVSASQLERMPRFNQGQDRAHLPYQIFRFRTPTAP